MKSKYIISKADGTPVDPKAKYLVLRYDHAAEDSVFKDAVYESMLTFITGVINSPEVTPKELDIVNKIFDDMQKEKELDHHQ